MTKIDISIIIVSYNTRDTTRRCLLELDTILAFSESLESEVIVVDNASTDGSATDLKEVSMSRTRYSLIHNTTNMGFGKANNIGLQQSSGQYVLFLNSDVMVSSTDRNIDLNELMRYMDSHPKVGALTVRVELPDGNIDTASHRGFPTPWRSFTYLLKIEKFIQSLKISNKTLFKMFGGYHLLHEDLETIHPIDSGTAAFLLCQRDLIDRLRGFDEQFFMYGEDLDLCYRMKEMEYQVVWYPKYSVIHLKYQSGLRSGDIKTKHKIRWHFYDAMEKFYRKHYETKSCPCINMLILTLIKLVKRRNILG